MSTRQQIPVTYCDHTIVDADLTDDSVSIYPTTLAYTGEKIDDVDQIAVWEAVDRDTYATSRLKAAERKHARSSELDIALEPLTRLITKANTRADAQAIIRVVAAKLDEAWWIQR